MKQLLKYLFLFLVGGITYFFIEILFRGYSHWTMAILGGICFVIIGLLNEISSWDMALISQMFLSAVIITTLEFVIGLIINVWLGWNIWDYINQPYNLMGQICLLFSNLWFLLSLPAIILDDYLRYWVLGEEKPHYKIF